MLDVVLTPNAEEDLLDIWLYIAGDSLIAADRVLIELQARINMLANNSELGEYIQTESKYRYRRFCFANYAIYYRSTDQTLVVIRVLHGAQNQEATLSED